MSTVAKFTRGAVAGNGWTNASRATADDGSYATCGPSKNQTTTGDWDWDAFTDSEIPVGSTIDSVTLEVQWKVSTTSSVATFHYRVGNNGSFDTDQTDTSEPTGDKTSSVAYAAAPSETDVKTAGRLVARIAGQRGNSNTAVTFSLDYAKLTVAFTAPQPSASVTGTGGGVFTPSSTSSRYLAAAATGGGVASLAEATDRAVAAAATGGGVATLQPVTDRPATVTATAGGVATIDAEAAASAENHDATVGATGGGVASLAATSGRALSPVGTGGGVATVAQASDRSGVPVSTGGGVATMDATTDRASSPDLTGGGTVTPSITSARILAAALSGGGVLTADQATDRSAALTATAGGSVTVDGTSEEQPENHDASISLTGGGVVTLDPTTVRRVATVLAGGGVATTSATTTRLALLIASGGGQATLDRTGGHEGSVAVTGGGRVTVSYRTGGQLIPLPDGISAAMWAEPNVQGGVTLAPCCRGDVRPAGLAGRVEP